MFDPRPTRRPSTVMPRMLRNDRSLGPPGGPQAILGPGDGVGSGAPQARDPWARAARGRPRYIAVDGPIGAGKSTLARMLAESMGARLVEEEPYENPFLEAFYREPEKHALATQLHFLLQRFRQQEKLSQGDLFAQGGVVTDYVFAKDRLFAELTLAPHELALYDRIYKAMRPDAVVPDLVVYLQARTDVLLSRIGKGAICSNVPFDLNTSTVWPRPMPVFSLPITTVPC